MNLKSLQISTALVAMLAAAPAFASFESSLGDDLQTKTRKTHHAKPKKQQASKSKTAVSSDALAQDSSDDGQEVLTGREFNKKGEQSASLQKKRKEQYDVLNTHIHSEPEIEQDDEQDDAFAELESTAKRTSHVSEEDSESDSSSGSSSGGSDGEGEGEGEDELNPEAKALLLDGRDRLLSMAANYFNVANQEEYDTFAGKYSKVMEKHIHAALAEIEEDEGDEASEASEASGDELEVRGLFESGDDFELGERKDHGTKEKVAPKAKATPLVVTVPKAKTTAPKAKATPPVKPMPKATVPVTPTPTWAKKAVHAQVNIGSAPSQLATQVFSALPVMSYALAPKHDTATVQQQYAQMSATPDATKAALTKAYGKTATTEKVNQAMVAGYILKKALNAAKANQSLVQIDGKKTFDGRFKAEIAKAEEFSKMLAAVTTYNTDHSFKTVQKSDKSVDLILWNTHGKCAYATLNFKKVA